MALVTENLPAPTANGAGAWVNVATFGCVKTVTVTGLGVGTAANCAVAVEFSNESTPTAGESLSMWQIGGEQTFEVACRWMRAVVSSYKGGTPIVAVGGEDDGTSFVELVAPSSSGSGAAVDTSGLPLFKTIQVVGEFRGGLSIEISEDGGASWAQAMTFNNPGTQTVALEAADQMRVSRTNASGNVPTIWVGATEPPGGHGGSSSDTGFIVYNVKHYGATGNGIADDTRAIRDAVTACVAGGGGIVYFPNASVHYKVSNVGGGFTCITLPSNVMLLGESREGAILYLADNTDGSVRIIYSDSTTDATVSTLTLDGNKANQTVDEHRSGIFVHAVNRFRALNVISKNNTGDGIDIFESSQHSLVDGCYLIDNDRDGVVLNGSLSHDITLQNNIVTGNAAQQIDCEGPEGGFANISVLNNYLEKGSANDYALTLTGTDETSPTDGFVVTGNYIVGSVYCVYADGLTFANNKVVADGDANVAIILYRQVRDATIVDNHFECGAASTAPAVIQVLGVPGASDVPSGILIANNTIVSLKSGAAQDGIYIADAKSVRVQNNTITGTPVSHGESYGVEIRCTTGAVSIQSAIVTGNQITDFARGVLAWGNGVTPKIKNLDVSHNVCRNSSGGSPMGAAFDLNFDDENTVEQATCIGNSVVGVGITFFKYPGLPMLVGGSRNGCGVYSSATSPETVLIEQIGALCMARDTGDGYLKTADAGAATGWKAITHA